MATGPGNPKVWINDSVPDLRKRSGDGLQKPVTETVDFSAAYVSDSRCSAHGDA